MREGLMILISGLVAGFLLNGALREPSKEPRVCLVDPAKIDGILRTIAFRLDRIDEKLQGSK